MFEATFKPLYVGRHGEPAVTREQFNEMNRWCEENCKGEWMDTDKWLVYAFTLEADAIHFKLVWG